MKENNDFNPIESDSPAREFSEQDTQNRELIKGTTSLDELYTVLRQIGTIRGKEMDYDAEIIIIYIEGVKKGRTDIHFITRTYNIRNKVRELLGLPIPENEK